MRLNHKSKSHSLSVGVKASIVYFLANMINKAIAYLTTPLYTGLLTSEEFGKVSVFLSWVSLIGIVAMFSFQAGVFNNGMLEYKNDRDRFTYSLLILSNIITIFVGLLLFVVYRSNKDLLQLDAPLIVLMIAIFMLQPAYNFWITRKRFEYQYKASTIVMVIMNLLSPLVAIYCIKMDLWNNRVYDRLFGAELVFLAFYVAFYAKAVIVAKGKINIQYWKFAVLFNLPLIPHYLSQYMMSSADKIMISSLIGDSQAAYYSVAYSVAAVISIVWTSINASLVPFTYEKCEKKQYNDISVVVTPLWMIFAVGCLVLMVFAPELMRFMAPQEYAVGAYVIPPVIGGVFFQAMYYTFANINYYYKKTKYVMYASVTAAVINIALNYLLIPKYGFIVAGYTTLLSYVVQASIDYYAMRKIVTQRIFNLKIILALSTIVIATACVFPLLYKTVVLRYCVLMLLMIFGILFGKKLTRIMKDTFSRLKRIQ